MNSPKVVGRICAIGLVVGLSLSAVGFSAYGQQSDPRALQEATKTAKGDTTLKGSTTNAGTQGVYINTSEDYRIGPRDSLEITVEHAPELSGIFEVNVAGLITLASPVNQMTVKGKTSEAVAAEIAEILRGGYLVNPHVRVTVKTSHRYIAVLGEVRSPGLHPVEGSISLLTLLPLVGGVNKERGSIILVFRPKDIQGAAPLPPPAVAASTSTVSASDASKNNSAESEYEILTANLTLLFKGNLSQNLVIEPNDIILVPQADYFYITGEVEAPGQFILNPGTTFRQAISLAQGKKFTAKSTGTIYRQNEKTGKFEDLKIDVNAVMSNKQEDFLIQPNDIIFIPGSKAKSVGAAVLSAFGLGVAGRGRVAY